MEFIAIAINGMPSASPSVTGESGVLIMAQEKEFYNK